MCWMSPCVQHAFWQSLPDEEDDSDDGDDDGQDEKKLLR